MFHDSHDQCILSLFQLQALGGSRSVCDPQRTDYFCNAGKEKKNKSLKYQVRMKRNFIRS